jgi:hypothetical protein
MVPHQEFLPMLDTYKDSIESIEVITRTESLQVINSAFIDDLNTIEEKLNTAIKRGDSDSIMKSYEELENKLEMTDTVDISCLIRVSQPASDNKIHYLPHTIRFPTVGNITVFHINPFVLTTNHIEIRTTFRPENNAYDFNAFRKEVETFQKDSKNRSKEANIKAIFEILRNNSNAISSVSIRSSQENLDKVKKTISIQSMQEETRLNISRQPPRTKSEKVFRVMLFAYPEAFEILDQFLVFIRNEKDTPETVGALIPNMDQLTPEDDVLKKCCAILRQYESRLLQKFLEKDYQLSKSKLEKLMRENSGEEDVSVPDELFQAELKKIIREHCIGYVTVATANYWEQDIRKVIVALREAPL